MHQLSVRNQAVEMRTVAVALILTSVVGVAVVSALPRQNEPGRIVGGSETTINKYPHAVVLMSSMTGLVFSHMCGGTIINNKCVLTAAHCFLIYRLEGNWRSRVGSSYSNSGGIVLNTEQIIRHPNFGVLSLNNDIAVLRVTGTIPSSATIGVASIAGPSYNVGDNQPVWAIGWGTTCFDCPASRQLQHVQVWTISHEVCVARYAELRYTITDSMLCSGWLDVGGRDQCSGDSGGPLLHNNVVVGVCSWGHECAHPRYPGVNARVSTAAEWIVSVANAS